MVRAANLLLAAAAVVHATVLADVPLWDVLRTTLTTTDTSTLTTTDTSTTGTTSTETSSTKTSSTKTSTTETSTTKTSTTLTETSTTLTVTSSTSTTETHTSTSSTTDTKTTTTHTSTTATTTTHTITTTTTSTSTSTTGPHVFGGKITQEAFKGWLSVWRSNYQVGLWNAEIPDPWESLLPKALAGAKPYVVKSSGGVAGGIVTEGMGYGIMIEGFLAAKGDGAALNNSLSLIKSWLGMVNGGVKEGAIEQPFAGGENASGSATKVDQWPYGVSAVEWSHDKLGPAGVPAWKFPLTADNVESNEGSATDGDQDAILGMVYAADALGYPEDFVDVVVRSIVAFASADLGFPDLYRVLPGGAKVFVPKLGSMWGGLLPPHGKFKTKQQPWCYSPGYFAPAHYRAFRDFLLSHWKDRYNDYLPPHLDGTESSLKEMAAALDSAVTAGYNLLYYSSCSSGTVSNWVGVEAACGDHDDLHCAGVPWAHTPYVGEDGGECAQSGTRFGAFGADASRAAWRIAMDYVLHREESSQVTMYDRHGHVDEDLTFGAQRYLNRIVIQYASSSICDGGQPGDCFVNTSSPFRMAYAYDLKFNATNTTCDAVPNKPESWWAGFMAYPTFTAFVAPYDEIGAEQMKNWMDTFSSICDFSAVNLADFSQGGKPTGAICLTSYFEASQAVISTMIMADTLRPISKKGLSGKAAALEVTILKDAESGGGSLSERLLRLRRSGGLRAMAAGLLLAASGLLAAAAFTRRGPQPKYNPLDARDFDLTGRWDPSDEAEAEAEAGRSALGARQVAPP